MGNSIGISCKECDYSVIFWVGTSRYFHLDNLADFDTEITTFPELIDSENAVVYIKYLLKEKNAVIANTYRKEIYHCSNCDEFCDRFFIHLDYEGGSFEVEYKCPRCKAPIKPVDYDIILVNDWEERKINLKKYPCPKCGKVRLYEDFSTMIDWW